MSHLPPFVLCLAGFAALALATDRQQRTLIGRPLQVALARVLRIAGWFFLVMALGGLVYRQGWGLGLVMFSGHTSLAAGVVHCILIGYSTRRARSSSHS